MFKSGFDYVTFLNKIVKDYLNTDYNDINSITNFETADDETTFILNSNQLIIHFNPYEIACYAEGDIEVKIPHTDLINFRDI